MARTKFVSVTRTGNECDIIEPFVRHHAALFDRLLIIDDDSSDGTWPILEKLRGEGLPLLLWRASEVDWGKVEFTTRLMHIAFEQYGADWVAPLDVDEFLEPPAGAGLADVLLPGQDVTTIVSWSNFAWHRGLDEGDRNPVVRLVRRMPPRTDSCKVIVPRDAWGDARGSRLGNGHHRLWRNDALAPFVHTLDLAMCHYPIRSIQQYVGKAVTNYLLYAALPNNDRPEVGFQYRRPFDLAKGPIEQLLPGIVAEMEHESQIYALQPGGTMVGTPADRPLDYRGGPLLHSDRQPSAMTNLIILAERFARRVAELESGMGVPSGL